MTANTAPRSYESKILSRETMRKERERLRAEGKVFVFTNGCFDILHAGHVDYLAFARRQGDVLAVGLNSDRSVRQLKGPPRPVVPQEDRATLLAALEVVDYVVIFDEVEVLSLITELLPDILVKGEDRSDWVCGREVVEQHGGRVVLAPVTKPRSTTGIIGSILESHQTRA
jgi:D-beta-D-heptose 7-phosphate kinase/D-beta-D-heptose 1-phosphate adenosyltransferase